MTARTRDRRPRGLGDELRHTFRMLLGALVLVGVVLAALSGVLLASIQPDLRHDTEVVRALRMDHESMLDQDTGLRSWLATGDLPRTEGREGSATHVRDRQDLLGLLGHQPELDRAIVELQLAAQTWIDRWAQPVSELDPATLESDERAAIFADGQQLFDRYREAQRHAVSQAAQERDEAMVRIQRVIAIGFSGVVLLVLAAAVQLTRQRRRLDRGLAGPLRGLVAGMEAIQRGEAFDANDAAGPAELQDLAKHLQATGDQVRAQHRELELQRADSEAAAVTLRSILTVAREIAGSLNVRYVAETVARAAADITPCERAVVWLTSDGEDFVAVHDSSLQHGVTPEADAIRIGSGAIGTVARDARPQVLDGSACFPLVVGGRVMGVLQLVGSGELNDAIEGSLETLATHGAAALEAARLHRAAEELAQVDALTLLLNRRRLDSDMVAELDRANRYGRPLGFILLDLDRFKLVNDTFGHLHGDEVLRLTGECLAASVRSSDTVYRYGGEEFAVLVREGSRSATMELAERLRAGVAAMFTDRPGYTTVTASFGVALAPEHGQTSIELIQSADAALYAAKEAGRDRVELAPLGSMLPVASAARSE